MTVGTVPYMAPEQALADPVDERTDVYGLGVTMFHMLTGTLPFDDESDTQLVAKLLYATPPLPSARRPGLDPRLDRVLLAAIRKRPENRYPSMTALEEDLERILGQRSGAVLQAPLIHEPDHYEAVSPAARSAAEVLRTVVPR